ncbi:RHS repeat-associated core domain-containing protein [Pseudoalteromonas sp. T1lg65]|uniref:RHS repeat-associated core domain-containing protein n=1 Tax=Pseudoalteromonas sp. T1lg65 TaxID=2077101 RepID=UPI003F7A9D61
MYCEKGENLTGEGTNYIYLGKKLIAKYGDVTPTSTAESRQHYRPYGESIEGAKDDIGYTGHKFDKELGLSYMQARYYDPVIVRFYSNDLLGVRDVHSFNRYAYANNNPYKYIDPTGMFVVYAGGLFFDISTNGLVIGSYYSGEGGSSTGVPGVGGGIEFGFMSGNWKDAMIGPYTLAGVEGKAVLGGSISTVTTLSGSPELGMQLSLLMGSPKLNGFQHTGGGSAEKQYSITGDDVSKGIKSINDTIQYSLDNIRSVFGQNSPFQDVGSADFMTIERKEHCFPLCSDPFGH